MPFFFPDHPDKSSLYILKIELLIRHNSINYTGTLVLHSTTLKLSLRVHVFHLNQFGHFKDREILLKDNFAHTLLKLSTLSEYQIVNE